MKSLTNLNTVTNYVIDTLIYGKDKQKSYNRWFGKGTEKDIAKLERGADYLGVVANIGGAVVPRLRDRVARAMMRKVDLQNRAMDVAEDMLDEAETFRDKATALKAVNSVIATKVLPDSFDVTALDDVKVIEPDVTDIKGLIS